MMEQFVSTLLRMSITAGIVIIAVFFVRLLLKKAPAVFSYALWFVVLFRLLCPVSMGNALSVFNLFQGSFSERSSVIYSDLNRAADNVLHTGSSSSALSEETDSALSDERAAASVSTSDTAQKTALTVSAVQTNASQNQTQSRSPLYIFARIWLLGCGAFLLITLFSVLHLHQKILGRVRLQKQVYLCDHVTSAFVIGVFHPRIYLSSALTTSERALVLRHEQCHIRRGDHILKLLFYFAAILHWFNPLVWIAFKSFVQDMEQSCDELVIRSLNQPERLDYAQALLNTTPVKQHFYPLATFTTQGTKHRVLSVLHYKKPRIGTSLLAGVLLCFSVLSLGCDAQPLAAASNEVADDQTDDFINADTNEATLPPDFDWISCFTDTDSAVETVQPESLSAYNISFDEDTDNSRIFGNYRITFHQMLTDGHFYHLLMTVNTIDHTPIPYSALEPVAPDLGDASYNTYRMNAFVSSDDGAFTDLVMDMILTRLSPYEESDQLIFTVSFVYEGDLPHRHTHELTIHFEQFFFSTPYTDMTLMQADAADDTTAFNLSYNNTQVLSATKWDLPDSSYAFVSPLGIVWKQGDASDNRDPLSVILLHWDDLFFASSPFGYSTSYNGASYTSYLCFPCAVDTRQISYSFYQGRGIFKLKVS
jgi:beta-lactamase regulating signal transducer with metallopeptidase domain